VGGALINCDKNVKVSLEKEQYLEDILQPDAKVYISTIVIKTAFY
jgi:hypothetical protein